MIADGGIRYSGRRSEGAGGRGRVRDDGLCAGGRRRVAGRGVPVGGGAASRRFAGWGSLSAMRDGAADRYFQDPAAGAAKLVPEGIEGRVPYKGPVRDTIFQLVGGLRSGMGYVGAGTLEELRDKSRFVRVTPGGLLGVSSPRRGRSPGKLPTTRHEWESLSRAWRQRAERLSPPPSCRLSSPRAPSGLRRHSHRPPDYDEMSRSTAPERSEREADRRVPRVRTAAETDRHEPEPRFDVPTFVPPADPVADLAADPILSSPWASHQEIEEGSNGGWSTGAFGEAAPSSAR